MHIAKASMRTACCAAMRTLPVRRSVPKIAAAAASATNSRFNSLVTPISSKHGIQGDSKYLDFIACYKEEDLNDLEFELLEFDFDLDELEPLPELPTLTEAEALTRPTKDADGLEQEDAFESESASPEPNQPREEAAEAVTILRIGLEIEAAHGLDAGSESDLESELIDFNVTQEDAAEMATAEAEPWDAEFSRFTWEIEPMRIASLGCDKQLSTWDMALFHYIPFLENMDQCKRMLRLIESLPRKTVPV
jgi:hypothetical protein